jgi:hypothetical protein
MTAQPNSSLLDLLVQQLQTAHAHDESVRSRNASGEIIQVPGTGKRLSAAYEQLRNAAEYTEEHLLLQRAIRRFYKRSFAFGKHQTNIGEELIVELTQAGYLQDASFSKHTAHTISQLSSSYSHTFASLRQAGVSGKDASEWVLALLSVEVEGLLNPHTHHNAITYVAYQHYLEIFPRETLLTALKEEVSYELSLYIAVHQALLKSDIAVVRFDLMRMYQQSPENIQAFIEFNRSVDALYTSELTGRLRRAVNKYGAPLRIVKSMTESQQGLASLIPNRDGFLDAFDRQVSAEYNLVGRRLNKGIIKSIIFIFITKIIIGVGIEVPYDLIVIGEIAMIPLIINLLFPPLYMATLRLGLKVPTQANALALRDYIDKILYTHEPLAIPPLRDAGRTVPLISKLLYGLLFLIPFAITVYVLMLLHFNVVQMIIFFTFLSTASFLGFRLSSMIRELEIMSQTTRLLSTVRDFFYLPFILVGQWLSSKYAKINAVAYFLDIAIELPLKSALRLLRQWTRFLSEKHDDMY